MDINNLTWIVYAATGIIYWAIIYTCFSSVFEMRFRSSIIIGIYSVFCLIDIIFTHLNYSGTANIIKNILFSCIIICLYSGSLKARISIAIFIYMAFFLSEFLTMYGIIYIQNIPFEQISIGTPAYLYGLLISRAISTIFAKIMSNIIKHHKIPKLTTLHWVAITVTPVGSIFVLYNMLFSQVNPSISYIISSIIIVIINFVVLHVYDKILADYEANVKNKLLEEQIKHYDYQYFLAESSEKIISKTKHDIKNLLIGLQADIHNNKIENVNNRITELLGDIDALDGPAKSGNIAIDSIINFKVNIARKHKIVFSVDLKIPNNLKFDSTTLCSVLGNALDNAIEATEKLKDESRKTIQIFMSYKQETLFLQITNPFEGEMYYDTKGRILSSKRNYRSEGIGLHSIKSTLKNDRGNVKITHNENNFSISIALFSVNESKGIIATH